MLKADLHIHSSISDGSNTICEIIENAIYKGLDVIAITDHDTLSHIAQIPKTNEIKVIAGIEISAIDKRNISKAHILGYNIQSPELVENLTLPLLKKRHKNSLKQIEILNENGYSIYLQQLNNADGKYIYKQHIMEYLVRTGQVAEIFGDFYKSTFKNGGLCDFDIEYIDVYDAVKIIKLAGGKAVLAHCGQQQNFTLIPSLIELGLDGLEYNHSANSENDKKIIKEYANKYNLFLTGGSDYHGKYEVENVNIGDYLSDESGVHALC